MGRVIYGMMQSLDGYIAGAPGGPPLHPPSDALHWVFNEQMKHTTVAVYGRTMYEIMRAWDDLEATFPQPTPVQIDFAGAWQKVPKVVISTTLRQVGPNARLISTDVEAQLRRLKDETDGTIDLAGPKLAASVSRMGLIDEYRLFLRPLVLGGGKPFFQQALPFNLRLTGRESLPECVMLKYEPLAQS
jgi:dihydrofolate reductase